MLGPGFWRGGLLQTPHGGRVVGGNHLTNEHRLNPIFCSESGFMTSPLRSRSTSPRIVLANSQARNTQIDAK
jgi:hypothetical protein